jgi:hypothetical protein
VATTELARPEARLELPGGGTTPATIEVVYQPRATRMSRAIIILVLSWVLMPVLFFIPPHFLWPLVSLIAGILLARRYWRGEYYVTSFEGACPRCDTAIEIKPGTRIRSRQSVECFGCHRQPELVVDDPAG